MATSEPNRSHLKLEEISNSTAEEILVELGKWLRDTARFAKEGENLEKCVDENLANACRPLFDLLDLKNKIKSRRWGYTVLRTGPGPARFHNTTGSAYLVPIRIITGCPMSSGVELKPGWTLYITDEIEVGPGLDGLFIAEL